MGTSTVKFLGLSLIGIAAASTAHPGRSLGPGRGPWPHVDPLAVGISPEALAKASTEYAKIGSAMCLSIVKSGALVFDQQYGFGAKDRPIESYSAGKTVTAALMGSAWSRNLFELDVPITDYGVPSLANWSNNKEKINYFPNVTAWHLLTQTTGVGRHPPGSNFTYDSNLYIAHLSYLLNVTATSRYNMTAREYATENFAKPLGIQNLYAYQFADPAHDGDTPEIDSDDEFCPGADQPLTCSEFARVGQLLLNNGSWLDESGNPFQLINESYVENMFTPQLKGKGIVGEGKMPEQYTFLSYMMDSNPLHPIQGPACTNDTNGLVMVPGMPNGTLLALGAMGRYLLMIPSLDLVVASFASNNAEVSCGWTSGKWTNKASPDLSAIWRAIGPAILGEEVYSHVLKSVEVESRLGQPGNRYLGRNHGNNVGTTTIRGTVNESGACYCYCQFEQGIGGCFESPKSKDECAAFCGARRPLEVISRFCPNISLMYDCQDPFKPCLHSEIQGLIYMSSTNCSRPPNETLGLSEMRQCIYAPISFSSGYYLANETCEYSPFFPNYTMNNTTSTL